jgi:hypothetical protein
LATTPAIWHRRYREAVSDADPPAADATAPAARRRPAAAAAAAAAIAAPVVLVLAALAGLSGGALAVLCLICAAVLAALALAARSTVTAAIAGVAVLTTIAGLGGLSLGDRADTAGHAGYPFPLVVGLPLDRAKAEFRRHGAVTFTVTRAAYGRRGIVLRATGYGVDGTYAPGARITLLVGSQPPAAPSGIAQGTG